MVQLSLFSQEELERCTLASNVLKNVRRAIRSTNLKNKPVPTMGQVIKFPIKKVS
jgi:hypothetical protein